ncbi:response regulator transcription factor [Saccharibacillus sacchari]|uniref:response regulator transcription factor n=1 Tax=Saccharibacillus sacchari TaxID=456493 RepID=UPI0004BCA7B2|nr:response regulator transcription factor [Saccharibacillus sacchari]
MRTILIVEDDVGLNNGIALALRDATTQIRQAHTLTDAREEIKQGGIDLVILDVRLPDGSGFDFCTMLRKESALPIIFLTANDLESDIVTGFALGGDDYITKPFSLMVLRARVTAVLRRSASMPEERLVYADLEMDFGKMEYVKKGAKLSLSLTEQKLLKLLVVNRGQILPRETLIDQVWSGESEFVEENALSVGIKRLRAKIEDDPTSPKLIKTVYGLGYTWPKEERE